MSTKRLNHNFILPDGQEVRFYKNKFNAIKIPSSYMLHLDPKIAGLQIDTIRKVDSAFDNAMEKLISTSRVRYFKDKDRDQTEGSFKNGVLYQKGLDRGEDKSTLSEGEYIFVIKDDKLYATKKLMTDTGKIQHSSFFAWAGY